MTNPADTEFSSRDIWLRLVTEQLPAILWSTDSQLVVTLASGAGLKLLGSPPNETTQKTLYEYFADSNHPAIVNSELALRGESATYSASFQGRVFHVRLEPLRNATGEIVGTIGLALDITERTHAEQEISRVNANLEQLVAERTSDLQAAHARLEESSRFIDRVASAAPAILYVYDLEENRNVYTNDKLWEILGYTAEEAQRQGTRLLLDNFHPDDVSVVTESNKTFAQAADGEIVVTEYRMRDARGEWHWLRSTDTVFLRNAQGRPKQILGLALEITAQKKAELAVQAEQRLLRRLIELQQRERSLFAYDIHDGFVQQLIGAQMRIAGLAGWDPPASPAMQAELSSIHELLRDTISEARRLIGELRPMVIDQHGLITAIDDLVRDASTATGIEMHFRHQVKFHRLPEVIEVNAFRIVQESLNNVKRHSQATSVLVRMREVEGKLRLEVIDNGVGFDPQRVPREKFGLEGIRERARIFGGSARIQTAPGRGCTITVDLPLTLPENEVPASEGESNSLAHHD